MHACVADGEGPKQWGSDHWSDHHVPIPIYYSRSFLSLYIYIHPPTPPIFPLHSLTLFHSASHSIPFDTSPLLLLLLTFSLSCHHHSSLLSLSHRYPPSLSYTPNITLLLYSHTRIYCAVHSLHWLLTPAFVSLAIPLSCSISFIAWAERETVNFTPLNFPLFCSLSIKTLICCWNLWHWAA